MSGQGSLIACPNCNGELPASAVNQASPAPCPFCDNVIFTLVFPAWFKRVEKGRSAETILDGAEASCFHHPDKRAVIACEACGRFLCSLCDIAMNNQHLCSGCVTLHRKKGKIKNLHNHRTLHDDIALAWAIYPILFWPLTLVTSLVALYTAIRHWNTPTSVVPRSRARFVWAIIIALIEILAWLAFFGYLLMERKHG